MDVVVNVVEMPSGTVAIAGLPSASVPSITETLNQADVCTIRVPKHGTTEADSPVIVAPSDPSQAYEYQVVIDDVLEFQGPAIDDPEDSGDEGQSLTCNDPLWYLFQRILDGYDTTGIAKERLLDADFEDADLSAWDVDSGITATKDTDVKRTGLQSLKIVNATANTDKAVRQGFSVTTDTTPLLLVFFVWVQIEEFLGPAFESRGLFVAGFESSVLQDYDYHPIDIATLDEPHVNGWRPRIAHLVVPASSTWDIQVSYMAFQGTGRWDSGVNKAAEPSVTTAQLTGSITEEVDVADWVELVVAHVQDAALGKSNLGIGFVGGPVGTTITKRVLWAEEVQFDEAIREVSDRQDGFDYEIDAERNFHIYPGGQGEDKTATVTLYYENDPIYKARKNIASYTSHRVIPKTRSKFQGDGDGVTRDVGEYADASQLGGLILQEVQAAPPRTLPAGLEPLARSSVQTKPRPFRQIVATLKNTATFDIGAVRKGDHVTVVINNGRTQVNAPFRCVSRTLHPYSLSAEVTLNEEVE